MKTRATLYIAAAATYAALLTLLLYIMTTGTTPWSATP